jgi:hypothetical protein
MLWRLYIKLSCFYFEKNIKLYAKRGEVALVTFI